MLSSGDYSLARVFGTVFDQGGEPVARARIVLTGVGLLQRLRETERTGPDGRYSIDVGRTVATIPGRRADGGAMFARRVAAALDSGKPIGLRIVFEHKERGYFRAELPLTTATGSVIQLTPILRPRQSADGQAVYVDLTGVVRDEEGKPVPGVTMTWTAPEAAAFEVEAKTDAVGRYRTRLWGVPPEVAVRFEKDGVVLEKGGLSLAKVPPGLLTSAGYDFVLSSADATVKTASAVVQESVPPAFRSALEALASQQWNTAVEQLHAALQTTPSSGGSLRLSDGRVVAYLPYLNLGIALYNLGDFEGSLGALETEESFDVVTTRPTDLENLRIYRRFARKALEDLEANRLAADEVTEAEHLLAEAEARMRLEAEDAATQEAAASAQAPREIDRLLSTALARLQQGQVSQAIASLNRAISLESWNETAHRLLRQAYGALNRASRASSSSTAPVRAVLPPVLIVTGPRSSGARFSSRSSRLSLAAVVVDDQPEIRLRCCGPEADERVLEGQPIGQLYRAEVNEELRLRPGENQLQLQIRDSDGLLAELDLLVIYDRPWWRAPVSQATAGLAALLLPGGIWLGRYRRRRRLLRRRFNPFVAGPPILDDDLFFGRTEILERILQTLDQNHILISGERRIGKTSLLHQIKRTLSDIPEVAYLPVYVDLEGVSEKDVFRMLEEEVTEELRARGLDFRGGSPPDESPSSQTSAGLARLIAAWEEAAENSAKLVLLIDEADELMTYSSALRDRLRRLIVGPEGRNLIVLLSGVGIGRVAEEGADPLFALFDHIEVHGLRREDAKRLIRDPVAGMFKMDDGVATRILDLTERKPYLIQRICVALVNRCHEEGRRRIRVADVDLLWAQRSLARSPEAA